MELWEVAADDVKVAAEFAEIHGLICAHQQISFMVVNHDVTVSWKGRGNICIHCLPQELKEAYGQPRILVGNALLCKRSVHLCIIR